MGGRNFPSPKFDSTIVAFGGGWVGASYAKLFMLGYLMGLGTIKIRLPKFLVVRIVNIKISSETPRVRAG